MAPATSNDGGIWKDPDSLAWPVATTRQWWTMDYGSKSNESNLPKALNQNWYLANPDLGLNEAVATTSLASPATCIVLADAARAGQSPSRPGPSTTRSAT